MDIEVGKRAKSVRKNSYRVKKDIFRRQCNMTMSQVLIEIFRSEISLTENGQFYV